MKKAVNADGINIIQSSEWAASQFVGYLHVQFIQILEGDGTLGPYSFVAAHGRSERPTVQDSDEVTKDKGTPLESSFSFLS